MSENYDYFFLENLNKCHKLQGNPLKKQLQFIIPKFDEIGWPTKAIAVEVVHLALENKKGLNDLLIKIQREKPDVFLEALRRCFWRNNSRDVKEQQKWLSSLPVKHCNPLLDIIQNALSDYKELLQQTNHLHPLEKQKPDKHICNSQFELADALTAVFPEAIKFVKKRIESHIQEHPFCKPYSFLISPGAILAKSLNDILNNGFEGNLAHPLSHEFYLKLKVDVFKELVMASLSFLETSVLLGQSNGWIYSYAEKSRSLCNKKGVSNFFPNSSDEMFDTQEVIADITETHYEFMRTCAFGTRSEIESKAAKIRKFESSFKFFADIYAFGKYAFNLIDGAEKWSSLSPSVEDVSLLTEYITDAYGVPVTEFQFKVITYIAKFYTWLYSSSACQPLALMQLVEFNNLTKDQLMSRLSERIGLEKPDLNALEYVVDILSFVNKADEYENIFFKGEDEKYFILPWNLYAKPFLANVVNAWWGHKKSREDESLVGQAESSVRDLFAKLGCAAISGKPIPSEYEIAESELDVLAYRDGHLFVVEQKRTGIPHNLWGIAKQRSEKIIEAWWQLARIKKRFDRKSMHLDEKLREVGCGYSDVQAVHYIILTTDFSNDGERFGHCVKRSFLELNTLIDDWINAKSRDCKSYLFSEHSTIRDFADQLEKGRFWQAKTLINMPEPEGIFKNIQ